NGLLKNETDNGITRTAYYSHRYPIATYLIAFAVTNYTVLNHVVPLATRNLPMITYCYPESIVSFQQNTHNVIEALQLYHQWFGDYPFLNERYGHTQFSWGGGMEHQTNSFIVSTDENLMAHELAHQWFGDKITCSSWEDIWLNEGFATYLSYFYFEKRDAAGHFARLKNLNNNITSVNNGSVWVNDTNNVNRIFDGRLTYFKGAYLLHMLRWVLGDNDFFNGIRQYVNDSKIAYGFARTADLQRNLEQVSGKNLTEFFKDWYKGEGHPTYTIRWSQNKNNWAKINVAQMSSHNSVSFFEMPLALRFKKGSLEKTVLVNNTFNNQIFWEDIGFAADTVLVDPDYWILSRNNSTIKETSSLISNEIEVFPNPATTAISVSIKNPSAKKLIVRLFKTNGQLILEKEFSTPGSDEVFLINTSSFARGVYILQAVGNGLLGSKKIILR
ncbi:MAG: T9SS type A sorting domain-containing protein, partial [Chitinophagaceae bacterium]